MQDFEETSRNEKEHAKFGSNFLHDGKVPATEVNLVDAADGRNYEWTDMYAGLQNRKEGFTK